MSTGSRIRAARQVAGLTQEELARRAGVSLKIVGLLERGETSDPHVSNLQRIARALEIPIGDLLAEEFAAPLVGASSSTSEGDARHLAEWEGALRQAKTTLKWMQLHRLNPEAADDVSMEAIHDAIRRAERLVPTPEWAHPEWAHEDFHLGEDKE